MMSRGVVTQVGEFTVDDGGQLDLGLPDSELPSPALLSPTDADDWVDEGWIPGDYGDPETDPDDSEAWLASLPADIRAEYLAGAWTGDGETIPAGFLHHLRSGPGGVGFASGGVLDEMVPGSWLGDALVTATAEGDDRLGESELIGVLCAWRRMSSWAAAGETAAVMELVRRRQARSEGPGDSRLADHINDELAAALTLTGRSADRLISMSFGLARLDVVYAALRRGEIDWAKACLFVSELAVLADDDVAREIASRLLARAGAGGWTTGQLRAALRRAVLAADPKSADRRRHEARKDAEVQSWDEASGNAALAGRELPPADVIAADSRLTALARWLQDHGATGTISQLRAEVYLALLADRPVESLLPGLVDGQGGSAGQDGSVGHGQAADQGGSAGQGQSTEEGQPADEGQPASAADSRQDRGSRPADRAHAWPAVSGSIHLTMPLAALLGGGQPGEVAGRGPVDASTCREIAAMLASGSGTRWSLTVTGADGRAVGHASARSGPAAGEPVLRWAVGLRSKLQFLESGDCSHARQSARYRPPASLRNLVMVRQRRCAFPGCRRPAIRCDLDHTVPFDEGGRSCECNLAPLCRRHHQAKQAPGWCLEQLRPGAMTWRMPSGRCYQTAGEPYPI